MLSRLREQMAQHEVTIELTDEAKELLVEKGYDPAMGARPLRRAIQRYIEDPLADFVLGRALEPGSTILVAAATRTASGRRGRHHGHPRRGHAGEGDRAARGAEATSTVTATRGEPRTDTAGSSPARASKLRMPRLNASVPVALRRLPDVLRSERPVPRRHAIRRRSASGSCSGDRDKSPSRSAATDAPSAAKSPVVRCVRRVTMAKPAVQFACTECGYSAGRWFGTLPGLRRVRHARRGGRRQGGGGTAPPKPLLRLVDVEVEEAERISTGVPELDRVLGGGLVPGLARARRRRAGRRQVDAAADGAAGDERDAPRAARHGRGVGRAGEAARRAARRRRRTSRSSPRPSSRPSARRSSASGPTSA